MTKKEEITNARVTKNLTVLKLLASKDKDCEININKRREIINTYSGWGGLRPAIYTPSVYRELKRYLTDEQISNLKKTTNSAQQFQICHESL